MLEPTGLTWILIIFGLITCGPLLYAQLIMVRKPHSEKAKKWMIGKGEGIHWPDLDEDISVENILFGKPSDESQHSLKQWLLERQKPGKPANKGEPT